jgi:hypothetical protein
VDGLKDEIKSVVLVQCPVNLDTACTLALLQEEEDSSRCRDHRRPDSMFWLRTAVGPTPLPPPLPPTKVDKPPRVVLVADNRTSDATRANSVDGKVAFLCAYHRARGLCQFCAEKWIRGHKCAATV